MKSQPREPHHFTQPHPIQPSTPISSTLSSKPQQIKSSLSHHVSSDPLGLQIKMNLLYVLGTNINQNLSANIYAYHNDQLIYYIDNMVIKYNLINRDYQIFYVDNTALNQNVQEDCQFSSNQQENQIINKNKQNINQSISNKQLDQLLVTKFFICGANSLLAILKKINGFYYLCLFWSQNGTSATEFKISNSSNQIYTNFTFHYQKGYLYFLYIHNAVEGDFDANHGKYQYIKVMEIQAVASKKCSMTDTSGIHNGKKTVIKHKVLLDYCIKKTGGGVHNIDDLIVGEDYTQVYLFGADYFRQWRLSFTERSIKQSNYRNIERNIKKQRIINIFWVKQHLLSTKAINSTKVTKTVQPQIQKNSQSQKKPNQNYLIIITQFQVLFIQNNQLLHKTLIPIQSPIYRTQKQQTQLILQRSLNQIYKTKFRVQKPLLHDCDDDDDDIQQKNVNQKNINHNNVVKLTSASNSWVQLQNQVSKGQKQWKVVKFCGALDSHRIFIYKILPDLSVKIESCIKAEQPFEQFNRIGNEQQLKPLIQRISASTDGSLLVFTDAKHQNFLSNQKLQNNDLIQFYNVGHGHTSQILSISSPQINYQITTVAKDKIIKIWNYNNKDRCVAIDAKFKGKPSQAIMHPSGFMVIVNFGTEIKTFAIVINQLQQVSSAKPDNFCSYIQLNKVHNILISNEKCVIKLYDPITLFILGKIQSQDLRLQFQNIQISTNGQYILYQNLNHEMYRKTINSILTSQTTQNIKDYDHQTYFDDEDNSNQNQLTHTFCHKQSQRYTCYYYDFGLAIKQSLSSNQSKISALSINNIFIGFTLTKFMTIYSNYGENLIAEFPVKNNVYVTQCSITQYMIFLGTSNGKILAYPWPILQSSFQLEILNNEKTNSNIKTALYKLKSPTYQFLVWKNYAPISTMYKIPNHHQLVVGGVNGLIGFVNYGYYKNGYQVFDNESARALTSERKKMSEAMNNIRFMRVSDIEKISKLIEKTQCDIQKIDYQIYNEKNRKNNMLDDEQKKLQNNIQKRKNIYIQQKNQKFIQQQKQLQFFQNQYSQKMKQMQQTQNQLQNDYNNKINIQKNQIQLLKTKITQQKITYKQKIQSLINTHKQNIKKLKQTNLSNIKKLQQQFEKQTKQNYCQQKQIVDIKQINIQQQQAVNTQLLKVQQLQQYITAKQHQLTKISQKASQSKAQDEQAQQTFQKNLQQYNQSRYQNLMLHAELLKIQNQLYQRKQILNKKDEIIQLTSQYKSINSTYKQFINGTINQLQNQKQNAYKQYIQKQQYLRVLFQQLTSQINKSQTKKLKYQQVKNSITFYQKDNQLKQQNIQLIINKLNHLKNYLLIKGINYITQPKQINLKQQKLLTLIKWLQKRFIINCTNQQKLTTLKQTGINQIVHQNKTLLQQCNLLRQQQINYQNSIHHLNQKLNQIYHIAGVQKKLSQQNLILYQQSQQLNSIRQLLQNQLCKASQDLHQPI